MFINTAWALLPPVAAIILALITKEVYSSLFIGIIIGGLLYAQFNPVLAMTYIFRDGMIAQLSSPGNAGILIFLVLLGILVILMNKTGGSAAFGRWASRHVKNRKQAQFATIALGVLIFIDDYFNCLTVGSVMRPVTDKHHVSREKLSYIIDATAAPVCIIAPISSWAAAVSGFVEGANGLSLFVRAIPYNFYAWLTIAMMIFLTAEGFDYGPMVKFEQDARQAETVMDEEKPEGEESSIRGTRGKVIHLVLPILVLIVSCVVCMIYTGGFFDGGVSFAEAFSNADAAVGLVYGSSIALIFTVLFCLATGVLTFKECMDAVPDGFRSMVPAILILILAWTLKSMTDSLGAAEYVGSLVQSAADTQSLLTVLPSFVFLIGCLLAFATGTSWGTFGILIPIVVNVFHGDVNSELMMICISACMAGAVCGDHCSPISDTTIMASAGARCHHINHVRTQLPYAVTAAAVSFVSYLLAGVIQNWLICLPLSVFLLIATLKVIQLRSKNTDRS